MEKTNISFDKIEILEWYDGIVRAIGEAESETYLIVLVAWNMSQSVKLYALVELSEPTKNKMIDELNKTRSKEENWEIFNSVFDHYIQSYNGQAYLILGEIKENKPCELKILESNHVKKLINYDFENTMSKNNIDFWFTL